MPVRRRVHILVAAAVLLHALPSSAETLAELGARLGRETAAAYDAGRFNVLSANHFSRFVRDPGATPEAGETLLTPDFRIVVDPAAPPLATRMAGHLAEFLAEAMDLTLTVDDAAVGKVIHFRVDPTVGETPGTFRIEVEEDRVEIVGTDAAGVRDGVVHLADRMGLRQAPILAQGATTHVPRLRVRLGATPRGGSTRDLVFLGYNAVFSGGGSLYALSESDAIPELAARRVPGLREQNRAAAAEARAYGLKTYAFVDTRQKFPEDDPVFAAHPEIRGARTWKADGEFTLCTEHPRVRQWLHETVRQTFETDPELDGLVLIIGGEGFYHCFMRPHGVPKGRSNCARCDAIGAPDVVANLVNGLADAARAVNPKAEVVAWPYSAEHVWSEDREQSAFIARLKPGAALFTEIEKDEYVAKPDGVRKHLWDYSIDLIGPGERAARQVELCRAAGIPIYMKSEPELAFEAPRLPHIPCMDRWVARANALADCGADGAWVFPAFRANYGTSAAEINKFFWWHPAPEADAFLDQFARRIAGAEAGPRLRQAWRKVSEAIEWVPELPTYYTGPYYLGPAHPMIVDKDMKVPEVFYGHYLFHAEIADAEGLKKSPTYFRAPRPATAQVFGRHYERMADLLKAAVDEIDAARPQVPEAHRLMFDAEAIPIAWFYRTARAQVNFHRSCALRDRIAAATARRANGEAAEAADTPEALAEAFEHWRAVLLDARENAAAAIPLVQQDVRLDWYYGSDHTFPHAEDMLKAKIEMIDHALAETLPRLAKAAGVETDGNE